MPYIPEKVDPLQRMLDANKLPPHKLAKVLNVSFPTAQKRYKDPKGLTVRELMIINKRGHVPIEEIRAAIQ